LTGRSSINSSARVRRALREHSEHADKAGRGHRDRHLDGRHGEAPGGNCRLDVAPKGRDQAVTGDELGDRRVQQG
jgi:hypothetical protein